MSYSFLKPFLLAGILVCSIPATASAHDEVTGAGIVAGMLHPVTGPDHLLAMLSVGILSAIMGGRNIWLIPLAFVSAMLAGCLYGAYAMEIPVAEMGIALSLVALGLAIPFRRRSFSPPVTVAFVFCFGLFHGYTHGQEMPKMAAPFYYTVGFLLSTIFIHVIGIFLGEVLSDNRYSKITLSITGYGVATAGLYFLIHSF